MPMSQRLSNSEFPLHMFNTAIRVVTGKNAVSVKFSESPLRLLSHHQSVGDNFLKRTGMPVKNYRLIYKKNGWKAIPNLLSGMIAPLGGISDEQGVDPTLVPSLCRTRLFHQGIKKT